MDPQRWRRVEELYHEALGKEPGRRAIFLAEACHGDEEMRREVESLLVERSGDGPPGRPMAGVAASVCCSFPRLAVQHDW